MLKYFNSLTAQSQWLWAFGNKDKIKIDLDNDCTRFTFNSEDKTDDCTLFCFKKCVGGYSGVEIVLNLMGFKTEYV